MLTVGDKFPDYNTKACVGLESKDLVEFSNAKTAGKWTVYAFYPKDFTFVCPTELVEFNTKLPEFFDRDATVIAGSTDNEFSHQAWRKSHKDLQNLDYPMIAAQKLAADLGILDKNENVCLRATFIVDPHGIIQYASVNNLNVGRNVDEVIRVLDAIQSDELCPCNWKPGEATLVVA